MINLKENLIESSSRLWCRLAHRGTSREWCISKVGTRVYGSEQLDRQAELFSVTVRFYVKCSTCGLIHSREGTWWGDKGVPWALANQLAGLLRAVAWQGDGESWRSLNRELSRPGMMDLLNARKPSLLRRLAYKWLPWLQQRK